MHLLEQELLLNGFIVKEGEQLSITSNGKKSLNGEVNAAQLNTLQIQERYIRYNTLESPSNENLLLRLVVVTVILAIVGLVVGLT